MYSVLVYLKYDVVVMYEVSAWPRIVRCLAAAVDSFAHLFDRSLANLKTPPQHVLRTSYFALWVSSALSFHFIISSEHVRAHTRSLDILNYISSLSVPCINI